MPLSPPAISQPSAGSKSYSRDNLDFLPRLQAARRGDALQLGELLAHYRRYLMLVASVQSEQRLQPRVSPSDIVQETMLRAHRHFAQFRGQSERELLGWLRQILLGSLARFAEQHVHTAKRDVRREVSLDQVDGAAEAIRSAASGPSPSHCAHLREQSQLLVERLGELPEQYREVLVLRHMEGLSFEETAARLNRSSAATRMLWLRALEKLRAVYRKAGEHEY